MEAFPCARAPASATPSPRVATWDQLVEQGLGFRGLSVPRVFWGFYGIRPESPVDDHPWKNGECGSSSRSQRMSKRGKLPTAKSAFASGCILGQAHPQCKGGPAGPAQYSAIISGRYISDFWAFMPVWVCQAEKNMAIVVQIHPRSYHLRFKQQICVATGLSKQGYSYQTLRSPHPLKGP